MNYQIPFLLSLVFILLDLILQSRTSDGTLLLFFLLYAGIIYRTRTRSQVILAVGLVVFASMALSYLFNGAIPTTERFAVWYVLLFLFGMIQKQTEK